MPQVYEGVLSNAASDTSGLRGGKNPRILARMLKEAGQRDLDTHESFFTCIMCWYICLSAWGVLRFNDHYGVDPSSPSEQNAG